MYSIKLQGFFTLFKRLLFRANLLTVDVITHPGCTEPCLTVEHSGTVTVACGDNYEAKIINVMVGVAFKRCPEQCLLLDHWLENQSDGYNKKLNQGSASALKL